MADPDCLHRVEEAIQHRILRNSGYFGTVDRPLCNSCTPRKGTLKDVILLVGGGNTEAMGLAQTWGYVVGKNGLSSLHKNCWRVVVVDQLLTFKFDEVC